MRGPGYAIARLVDEIFAGLLHNGKCHQQLGGLFYRVEGIVVLAEFFLDSRCRGEEFVPSLRNFDASLLEGGCVEEEDTSRRFETESPCRTPFIEPAARSPSIQFDKSIALNLRRSAKPSPFLENSGSHGQLTCTMSASVLPAIWVVNFSR